MSVRQVKPGFSPRPLDIDYYKRSLLAHFYRIFSSVAILHAGLTRYLLDKTWAASNSQNKRIVFLPWFIHSAAFRTFILQQEFSLESFSGQENIWRFNYTNCLSIQPSGAERHSGVVTRLASANKCHEFEWDAGWHRSHVSQLVTGHVTRVMLHCAPSIVITLNSGLWSERIMMIISITSNW